MNLTNEHKNIKVNEHKHRKTRKNVKKHTKKCKKHVQNQNKYHNWKELAHTASESLIILKFVSIIFKRPHLTCPKN